MSANEPIHYKNALGHNSMAAQRWAIALKRRRQNLYEELAAIGLDERKADCIRGSITEIEIQLDALQLPQPS